MVLYLSIVFVSMAIISSFNIWLGTPIFGYSPLWVIGMVSLSVVVEIAIQGIFATIVNNLPDRWFSHDKKIFKISKKERKFYEKIKIRAWKDKVWELGGLGGFRKNKIADPNNPDYFLKFVVESNKGITDHVVGMFLGFLVIFILPLKYALVIGVPVAFVNVILSGMPTMILRYNIPKLMVAYERAIRTQALQKKKEESESETKKEETDSEKADEKTENVTDKKSAKSEGKKSEPKSDSKKSKKTESKSK